MVIDIELTLNRFGFGKISENKFQFFFLRFSKWPIKNKYSISFEINWRIKEEVDLTNTTANATAPNKQTAEKERSKEAIVGLMESGNQPLTNEHVRQMLDIADATATRYLDELEKEGKIKQVGKTGAHVFYDKI